MGNIIKAGSIVTKRKGETVIVSPIDDSKLLRDLLRRINEIDAYLGIDTRENPEPKDDISEYL